MSDLFLYDSNSDSYPRPVILTEWDVNFIVGDKLGAKMYEYKLLCRQCVGLNSDYQRLLNLSKQAAQPALELLTEAIEKRDALWLEIGASYDERQRKEDEARRQEEAMRELYADEADTIQSIRDSWCQS